MGGGRGAARALGAEGADVLGAGGGLGGADAVGAGAVSAAAEADAGALWAWATGAKAIQSQPNARALDIVTPVAGPFVPDPR